MSGTTKSAASPLQTQATPGCPTPDPAPTGNATPTEPAVIAGQGYHLAFDDEFDSLNRSVWDHHIYYDGAPNPAWTGFQSVDNGVLHLRSSASYACPQCNGGSYPMNTVTTYCPKKDAAGYCRGQTTFTYGYFEVRMRWDGAGHGAYPGFWLWSYRHASNLAWPAINPYCAHNGLPAADCLNSEIDVADMGGQPTDLYNGVHRDTSDQYGQKDTLAPAQNWFTQPVDLSQDWHVYAARWTDTTVSFYLDGRLVDTVDDFDSTHQPLYLLLQNWTNNGACWDCGATNGTTTDAQFDWVRVWQQ